ncbi:MAG: hypothetical protein U0521_13070 [Anaerolineae bacterium]
MYLKGLVVRASAQDERPPPRRQLDLREQQRRVGREAEQRGEGGR